MLLLASLSCSRLVDATNDATMRWPDAVRDSFRIDRQGGHIGLFHALYPMILTTLIEA